MSTNYALNVKVGYKRGVAYFIIKVASLIPRPLQYVVWHYAARFLGKTETIGHMTSDH